VTTNEKKQTDNRCRSINSTDVVKSRTFVHVSRESVDDATAGREIKE